LIPRLVEELYPAMETAMEESGSLGREFMVSVSAVEIYLEKIRDLLVIRSSSDDNSAISSSFAPPSSSPFYDDDSHNNYNLVVREDAEHGVYLDGAREIFCATKNDMLEVIATANTHRHISSTIMNADSSRSHSVVIVNVAQRIDGGGTTKSRLYLVDLAGSEKVKKTAASGTLMEEAKMINKSLSALGNVINALTSGRPHIPFRDSKLTRLLQDSLGGNAKTSLVVTVSPSSWNFEETVNTLRFGRRAKAIKNTPRINTVLGISDYKKILQNMELQLAELQQTHTDLSTKNSAMARSVEVARSEQKESEEESERRVLLQTRKNELAELLHKHELQKHKAAATEATAVAVAAAETVAAEAAVAVQVAAERVMAAEVADAQTLQAVKKQAENEASDRLRTAQEEHALALEQGREAALRDQEKAVARLKLQHEEATAAAQGEARRAAAARLEALEEEHAHALSATKVAAEAETQALHDARAAVEKEANDRLDAARYEYEENLRKERHGAREGAALGLQVEHTVASAAARDKVEREAAVRLDALEEEHARSLAATKAAAEAKTQALHDAREADEKQANDRLDATRREHEKVLQTERKAAASTARKNQDDAVARLQLEHDEASAAARDKAEKEADARLCALEEVLAGEHARVLAGAKAAAEADARERYAAAFDQQVEKEASNRLGASRDAEHQQMTDDRRQQEDEKQQQQTDEDRQRREDEKQQMEEEYRQLEEDCRGLQEELTATVSQLEHRDADLLDLRRTHAAELAVEVEAATKAQRRHADEKQRLEEDRCRLEEELTGTTSVLSDRDADLIILRRKNAELALDLEQTKKALDAEQRNVEVVRSEQEEIERKAHLLERKLELGNLVIATLKTEVRGYAGAGAIPSGWPAAEEEMRSTADLKIKSGTTLSDALAGGKRGPQFRWAPQQLLLAGQSGDTWAASTVPTAGHLAAMNAQYLRVRMKMESQLANRQETICMLEETLVDSVQVRVASHSCGTWKKNSTCISNCVVVMTVIVMSNERWRRW
jgi:kinesin family protein 5